MFSLRPSAPSTVRCSSTAQLLYSHLSPSKALCPLYSSLSPLSPSVPSKALCPLYGPLSPLQPSVPSMALCSLYGPQITGNKAKLPLLFGEMFYKMHFVKTPRVVAIYFLLGMIAIIAIITIITQAKYSAMIAK
jgi:hypothetical protein